MQEKKEHLFEKSFSQKPYLFPAKICLTNIPRNSFPDRLIRALGSLCHDCLVFLGKILKKAVVYNQGNKMRQMIGFHHVILLRVELV